MRLDDRNTRVQLEYKYTRHLFVHSFIHSFIVIDYYLFIHFVIPLTIKDNKREGKTKKYIERQFQESEDTKVDL